MKFKQFLEMQVLALCLASIAVFFASNSLAAQSILKKNSIAEQQSISLIQKLDRDELYQLALLEIEWLNKNHPLSREKDLIDFYKGTILSKLDKHESSLEILSQLDFNNLSDEQRFQIFFHQAQNYFYLQEFNLSQQFFQRTANIIDSLYFLGIIAILQGNLGTATKIINQLSIKDVRLEEMKFLELIQNSNYLSSKLVKILAEIKLSDLKKVILIRLLAEIDFNNNNSSLALEKYSLLEQQNLKDDLAISLQNFFIGEAFYKNSLLIGVANFSSSDNLNLLKKSELYLKKHLQENYQPITQSHLYLANIYINFQSYQDALAQYDLLLENSSYLFQKDIIVNYLELNQRVQNSNNQEEILITAIDTQQNLLAKKELALKLLILYQTKQNCDFIDNYFLNNTGSLLRENNLTSATEYFYAGKCYFSLDKPVVALSYLKNIKPTDKMIILTTELVAQNLGRLKSNKLYQGYFSNFSDSKGLYLKQIKKNSLDYYYFAENWQQYIKQWNLFFKNNNLSDWQDFNKLGIAYQNNGQIKLALQAYTEAFALVKNKAKKVELAQNLINLYHTQKNFTKVAQTYESILDLLPEQQNEIKLIIAKNWLTVAKTKNAEKWFKDILIAKNLKKDSNTYLEASYYLAEILILQKNRKKAIELLTNSVKPLNVDDKWYLLMHYRLGQLSRSLKRWNNALYHFQAVTKTKGDTEEKRDAKVRVAATKKLLASKKKK